MRTLKRVSDIRFNLEDASRRLTRVELQLVDENNGPRIRGRLVKSRYSSSESYLLVDDIEQGARKVRLQPKSVLLTTFCTPRGYFRFRTELQERAGDAVKLSYPLELEVTQRRTALRVYFEPAEQFRVRIPARPGDGPSDDDVELLVVSLSSGGFSCIGDEPNLVPGQSLSELVLYLPGGGEVRGSGTVREVTDARRAVNRLGVGHLFVVTFDRISTENHLRLIRYISGVENARGGLLG
jgi:hypothetical protein